LRSRHGRREEYAINSDWIITRAKGILLTPREAWPAIAAEPDTVQGIYRRYVLFVAALPVIGGFLKTSLLGYDVLGVTVRLGVWAGLGDALLQYAMNLVVVYVVARIVDALAPTFGGERNLAGSVKAVAYAWTAAWVGGALVLLPWLGWLFSLAGAGYSIYLLRLGLPHTQKCPDSRASRYAGTVALLAVLLSLLLGSLFYLGARPGLTGMGAADLTLTAPGGRQTVDVEAAMQQLEAMAGPVAAQGTHRRPPGQTNTSDPEAQAIIAQRLKRMQEREAATFPCSLFTQAGLEALLGNPLDSGHYAFNHVDDNGHQYGSESCGWSAAQGGGNAADLWVSRPGQFASGRVECSPGSAGHEISGSGDQAWWEFGKSSGIGTLRVCSAQAMLEVKITLAGRDGVRARKIAETIAGKVLESPGSGASGTMRK
jgi:hypothetical protein